MLLAVNFDFQFLRRIRTTCTKSHDRSRCSKVYTWYLFYIEIENNVMWIPQPVASRKSTEHGRMTPHFMYMSIMLYFSRFLFLHFMLKRGLDKPINVTNPPKNIWWVLLTLRQMNMLWLQLPHARTECAVIYIWC